MAAAAAFNLSCSIAWMSLAGEPVHKPTIPIINEFRIDLAGKQFCSGDCNETEPIAKISATHVYLRLISGPNRKEYLAVNRESGEFESIVEVGGARLVETGVCTPSAFAGFPTRHL